MRIATHTASQAVRRVLEQAIEAAGHRLASAHEPAELTLVDSLHLPATALASAATLTLGDMVASDEHIACPIHPNTLIQRLAMRSQIQMTILGNGWGLDAQSRTLTHSRGEHHSLTEKECQLLRSIVAAAPERLGRESLLESVWGVGGDIDTHTLETHIYRLRSKLEGLSPAPGNIITEAGAYGFMAATSSQK